MTESFAALRSRSDPPPRGWLLARLAAALLVTAMAFLAWAMVDFGRFLRGDFGLDVDIPWSYQLHTFCRSWEGPIVSAVIAAAFVVAVVAAVRGRGRFRACAVIQAAVGGAALLLAVLVYWGPSPW